MKPLAIDLFCGLFQAEFLLRADAAIKKLVACGAKNPNHVGLSITGQSPSAIPFKFWSVSDFEDAFLSARFTCFWHVGISATEAVQRYILKLALGFVDWSPGFIFSSCPCLSQISSAFNRAFIRTISSIGIWRRDVKMRSAPQAIATRLRNVSLFPSASTPNTTLATK